MRNSHAALVLIVLAAFLIPAANKAYTQTAPDKLKVVVAITPSKNFKRKYKSDYYTDRDEGRRYAYWIQEDMIEGLNRRLNSRNKCGVWDVKLCDCTEDFEKAVQEQVPEQPPELLGTGRGL